MTRKRLRVRFQRRYLLAKEVLKRILCVIKRSVRFGFLAKKRERKEKKSLKTISAGDVMQQTRWVTHSAAGLQRRNGTAQRGRIPGQGAGGRAQLHTPRAASRSEVGKRASCATLRGGRSVVRERWDADMTEVCWSGICGIFGARDTWSGAGWTHTRRKAFLAVPGGGADP